MCLITWSVFALLFHLRNQRLFLSRKMSKLLHVNYCCLSSNHWTQNDHDTVNAQLIRLLYVKMEVTVIETNKGHKFILCEGFRYRLDVETKSRDFALLGYFSFAQMSICFFFFRFRSFGLFFLSLKCPPPI